MEMAEIISAIETRNIGELVAALKSFPADMAIDVELESRVAVCRLKPVKGEDVRDKRGYVKLMGISDLASLIPDCDK
jgi:hypothetical protein